MLVFCKSVCGQAARRLAVAFRHLEAKIPATPDTPMIEINLNAPNTPEEFEMNIARNVSLGRGANTVPFADDNEIVEEKNLVRQQPKSEWPPISDDDGKPRLRFFSVGPGTAQIRCPLCKKRTDAEASNRAGVAEEVSSILSLLSCCFPIFALSFVFYCCRRYTRSERLFCSKCAGYLGYYYRPT